MGILKIKELQSSNGDTVLGVNDDGTINITSQYNPGNVVLGTWDQTTRPSTGLFPGYVGYNTEKRRFELFTGFDEDTGDPIWYGVTTRVRFSAYDYTDTSVWDTNEGTMYDKAYLPMPSGPRTMRNYVTSFGLNQNSRLIIYSLLILVIKNFFFNQYFRYLHSNYKYYHSNYKYYHLNNLYHSHHP